METANNILYDKKVRNKGYNLIRILFGKPYYERENIGLKHKLYTFFYNMKQTGWTTQGEGNWGAMISQLDPAKYEEIKNEFEKDYIEYLLNPVKK